MNSVLVKETVPETSQGPFPLPVFSDPGTARITAQQNELLRYPHRLTDSFKFLTFAYQTIKSVRYVRWSAAV